jgi:hypothetical protein
MKTVKVVLIASLLVFTTVSYTSADGINIKPPTNVINVTIVQALGIPGLGAAMLQQLNVGFLGCGCQSRYTAYVKFQNRTYAISGTEHEWRVFFKWGYLLIGEDHNVVVGDN